MNTMFDCIDGDFFQSLAGGDVVYSDIDNVESCFQAGAYHRVLITHNGDRGVGPDLLERFLRCGMYDFWYAQNPLVRHERLIPLPIGFERKRQCPFSKFNIIKSFSDAASPSKTLYANFSVSTNLEKRMCCYSAFKGKPYVTDRVSRMLPHPSRLPEQMFRSYCREVTEHRFVLCPEGNGIDTHRFWETLALGRVPVVLHNIVNDTFAGDLPVLVLDRWEDFERESERFLAESEGRQYDYGCMTFAYWRKKILGEGE